MIYFDNGILRVITGLNPFRLINSGEAHDIKEGVDLLQQQRTYLKSSGYRTNYLWAGVFPVR